MNYLITLGCIVAVLGVGAALIFSAIRVVREYERLVVFRLGKAIGSRGPGVVFLIPIADQPVKVDLREQFQEIPHQTCITKDNVTISVDFLIYSKVVDAVSSVVQVGNFAGASQGIATTTLRAVIGDIILDDVLAQREHINTVLRTKLDEVTERWGVKVTAVEIREIIPPRDIQEAMTRQMSAERTRRAVVTEADGKRQAAITVADGDKQAVILRSEGDRQARILQAEGYSLALQTIFNVARGIDSKTLSLQYMDTLKQLGASPATKYIFPMEFTNLVQGLSKFLEQAGTAGTSEASVVTVPDSTARTSALPAEIEPPSGSGTGTSQTGT
ncbi:MAG: SPFH/Band 7/PHB domain protein [Chloroflexota bacterium]|nr:MAG: SPFH/Band 7/PHB domain protein [Chloroflexota bacterium]